MTLTWTRHEHITGTMCAVGLRGEYTITATQWDYQLQAIGHDTLPMPTSRFGYTTLAGAQARAELLDHTPAEAQISGS